MLPKPVYEALPFVYFALGALTMASIDSPTKYLSVFALVGAGVLVVLMRHQSRHKHKSQPARRRFHT